MYVSRKSKTITHTLCYGIYQQKERGKRNKQIEKEKKQYKILIESCASVLTIVDVVIAAESNSHTDKNQEND